MQRFRPATDADIDAVLQKMQRYYAEDAYPFMEPEARAAVSRLIGQNDLGRLWVAVVDGDIASYLAVTLGFSLEYRGRDAFRIGRFLMRDLVTSEFMGKNLYADDLVTSERHRSKRHTWT